MTSLESKEKKWRTRAQRILFFRWMWWWCAPADDVIAKKYVPHLIFLPPLFFSSLFFLTYSLTLTPFPVLPFVPYFCRRPTYFPHPSLHPRNNKQHHHQPVELSFFPLGWLASGVDMTESFTSPGDGLFYSCYYAAHIIQPSAADHAHVLKGLLVGIAGFLWPDRFVRKKRGMYGTDRWEE